MLLCHPALQQHPVENNSNIMVSLSSPLGGSRMNNRCQVSPQKQQQDKKAMMLSQSSSNGGGGGVMMRLPSKKRLMVRTWLPPLTVQTSPPNNNNNINNNDHHSYNNNQENNNNNNSTNNAPIKRRVHFSRPNGDPAGQNNNNNNTNDVIKTIYRYPKPSDRYYPNLYLSNHEKAEIQFLASSFGESFLFEQEDAVEHLERAFYNCDREITPNRSATLQRLEKELLNQESIVALQQWADTEARGLEDVVSAEFQDVRCRTTAMIIEYQAYLKKTLGSTADSDELIRVFSEKASARSRVFSTLMAQGDAHAAAATQIMPDDMDDDDEPGYYI
jgi:hypothetical protein